MTPLLGGLTTATAVQGQGAAVTVALVTGGVSLATAVVSLVLTQRLQLKTNRAKEEADAKLANLNDALTQQRDERSARRDYRYDALQRLYTEVNPLLFQLREYCEGSTWRVRRILREDIKVDSPHHVRTTAQRLLAPVVVAQEVQRHLTAVDLRVDRSIKAQYIVSREILWTLHAGTAVAELSPTIPYRSEAAQHARRQHLTFAQLQRLVTQLTVTEPTGTRRPMRLDELEDNEAQPRVMQALKPFRALFESASATTTPVLWRLLLAQACLMHVFVDLVDRGSDTPEKLIPDDIMTFRWAAVDDPAFEVEVGTAVTHVAERLSSSGLVVKK